MLHALLPLPEKKKKGLCVLPRTLLFLPVQHTAPFIATIPSRAQSLLLHFSLMYYHTFPSPLKKTQSGTPSSHSTLRFPMRFPLYDFFFLMPTSLMYYYVLPLPRASLFPTVLKTGTTPVGVSFLIRFMVPRSPPII